MRKDSFVCRIPDYLRCFLFVIFCLSALCDVGRMEEFCQFDVFNTSCISNEIIFVEEARYGRLQLGRCVTQDYGYLGCTVSVLDILDTHCSGRRLCELSVPTLRQLVQPCPKDLTAYLEITYQCIAVLDLTVLPCNSTAVLNDTHSSVYISSAASSPSFGHYGNWEHHLSLAAIQGSAFSSSCVLNIVARPGQLVNFTLFGFGQFLDQENELDFGRGASRFCPAHVFITEGQRTHGSPLCPFRQQRERHLYRSFGHLVSIYFSMQYRSPPPSTRKGSFVIKMEAVGCPDLENLEGVQMERYEDRLIVRCNGSHETWYLTCRNTNWIGTVGNCTEAFVGSIIREKYFNGQQVFRFGLVVAVVIGIILGIMSGLSLLIVVFFRRTKPGAQKRPTTKTQRLLGSDDTSFVVDNDRNFIRNIFYDNRQDRGMESGKNSCRASVLPPLSHHYEVDYTQMIQLQCGRIKDGGGVLFPGHRSNSPAVHLPLLARPEVPAARPEIEDDHVVGDDAALAPDNAGMQKFTVVYKHGDRERQQTASPSFCSFGRGRNLQLKDIKSSDDEDYASQKETLRFRDFLLFERGRHCFQPLHAIDSSGGVVDHARLESNKSTPDLLPFAADEVLKIS